MTDTQLTTKKPTPARLRELAQFVFEMDMYAQGATDEVIAALRAYAASLERAESGGTYVDTMDWTRLMNGDRRALDPKHQPIFDRLFHEPRTVDALDTYKEFQDYVVANMPPGTVISNPEWWAGRLWRAMLRAVPPPLTEFTGGAVPVLNPQGTGETGNDRPAAPISSAPPPNALQDLAKNVAGFDDRLLLSADLNLLRSVLREFRDQARAAQAKEGGL